VIKYIGSKRTLLPVVLEAVATMPDCHTVVDLFSGTSRVGHALKRAGYRVIANDHNAYVATLARCYVAADLESLEHDARRLLAELDALPLVALMEVADRVDSTCDLQMAYLEQWTPQAHNQLSLRLPELLPRAGKGDTQSVDRYFDHHRG
jgi:adenine-specific DNA-methyltransferase